MITKETREAAYRRLIADGRQKLGPAPTFEEVDALSRGELPEAEANRVRELLAHYPDLLRVMTEPFPPSGEGVLTDDQITSDLAKIRERIRREPAPTPPPVAIHKRRLPASTWQIAAGVVIALAIGGVAIRRMTHEPRPVATMVLYSDGSRGGPIDPRGVPQSAPAHISTSTDYTLEPAFSGRRHYRDYRVDLVDLNSDPPRRIWSQDDVQRQPDDTYPVTLETDDLKPGLYRLVLYGADGTDDVLAQYTLRVSTP